MTTVEFIEDPSDGPKIQVETPSGSVAFVLTQEEKEFYDKHGARYQHDNKFSNISDLMELDRILVAETMCYRWSLWLLREKDYWGEVPDVVGIQKNIDLYSKEIRALKRDLGIDKNTRDKEHGDSIAEYIDNLRLRAKSFGVHRNEVAYAAITKLKEIQSKVQLYYNYDEVERAEFHWHAENVLDWMLTAFAEIDAIDEEYRAKEQSIWIREM